MRMHYLLWEEPKAPDFVLEITSRATRGEDQKLKRQLYRRLGVREYWLYDPTADYLEPVLQGMELVAGEYVRLGQRELEDGTLVLTSAVLELELRLTERGLRFHDPVTGSDLLDLAETDAAWQRARQAREQEERAWERERQAREREEQAWRRERQALEAAERRIAELEARLRDRHNSER